MDGGWALGMGVKFRVVKLGLEPLLDPVPPAELAEELSRLEEDALHAEVDAGIGRDPSFRRSRRDKHALGGLGAGDQGSAHGHIPGNVVCP